MPNGKGGATAIHALHGLIIIVANPNCSAQIGCIANKPSIDVGIGGAGFACCRATNAHAAGGTANEYILQHVSSEISRSCIHNTLSLGFSLIENFAVAVYDFEQSNRLAIKTVSSENAISGSHFQGINTLAETAQGHSQVDITICAGINQSGNAHFFNVGYNLVHANFARKLNRGNVKRTLQSSTQANLAVPLHIGVLRLPTLCKLFLFIFNNTSGSKAVLHCRQINEGLEGRTGLTHSQGRTVEFILTAATNHGFNIASFGIDGSKCHLRLGELIAIGIIAGKMVHSFFSSYLHVHI